MFFRLCLVFVLYITTSLAIRCYTCDNESCLRGINGYVLVSCGSQVIQCYSLKNANQKVYKAGCLTTDCTYRSFCSSCDSDGCNQPLQIGANVPQIGGGTTFNSASFSFFPIILFMILVVCIFL